MVRTLCTPLGHRVRQEEDYFQKESFPLFSEQRDKTAKINITKSKQPNQINVGYLKFIEVNTKRTLLQKDKFIVSLSFLGCSKKNPTILNLFY